MPNGPISWNTSAGATRSDDAVTSRELYPDGRLVINNAQGWAPQTCDLGFRVNVDPIAATVPFPGALARGLIGVGLVRSRRWH